MDKKSSSGSKKSQKNHFECFRSEFRRKSHLKKKKSQNLPPNTEIFDIFEI